MVKGRGKENKGVEKEGGKRCKEEGEEEKEKKGGRAEVEVRRRCAEKVRGSEEGRRCEEEENERRGRKEALWRRTEGSGVRWRKRC